MEDKTVDPVEVNGKNIERLKNEDKKIKDRFIQAYDSEFWFCICFYNRKQKELFLEKTKAIALGDKYINGVEFARAIGIDLFENEEV